MWPFKDKPQPKRVRDLEDDLLICEKKISQLVIGLEGLAARTQKLEGKFYQHMKVDEQTKEQAPKEESLYAHLNSPFG